MRDRSLICLGATAGKILFNNRPITREEDEFIITAYNSHYELLDNLKALRRKAGDLKLPQDPVQTLFYLKDWKELFDKVDAIISSAEPTPQ